MFKSYWLILFFAFSKFVFAQVIDLNLVVIQPNGKKFTLYLNEEKINKAPEAIVKAFHVGQGWCKLKAEFETNSLVIVDSFFIKPIEKNNHKEITLCLIEETKGKKKAYFDFITIGEASGPEIPIVPEPPLYVNKHFEGAVFGNLYKIKDKKIIILQNRDSVNGKCFVNLNEKDIEHFVTLIKKTNDFSNRVIYTRNTILNNCYTCQQLIQILNLLEIEMDKLKLSKMAYNHLLDLDNAKAVSSVFKFKTMSSDYLDFLNTKASETNQKLLKCAFPISEKTFNEVFQSISNDKYEYDKLITAKKHLHRNCFTTEHLQKIVTLFSHDREKLDLLKTAFPVITNKEKYKVLSESFMFSESKAEFLNFISN